MGTQEEMRKKRHEEPDIDASIRTGLEEAIDSLVGKEDANEEGGSGDEQDGGSLHGSERDESESEERGDQSTGAEAELGEQEDEGELDQDDGSVEGEEEDDNALQGEEGEDEEEDEEGREEGEVDEDEVFGELEPPDFWPDQVKQEFRRMPPKSQEFYLNSYKGMQADYTTKTQAIAEIQRAIEPVREELAASGVSDGEMIRRFVAVHKRLEKDPREAIRWIGQLYGIDVSVPKGSEDDDEDVPPKVKEIDERLSRREVQEAIERAKSINAEVNKLRDEGKMPFYEEAEPAMMRAVAQIRRAGGQLPGVLELYEQVVWTIPELREKQLAQSRTEEDRRKLEEKKKNVAKSKRAAGKSEARKVEPAKKKRGPMTIGEELSMRFDEAARSRG